nr:MAG TPA: hypothetical protein [Caudoviricetes sp.]DAW37591.1 MAG TPA: hypothetical protein [Caudoviricetes sp.]
MYGCLLVIINLTPRKDVSRTRLYAINQTTRKRKRGGT